MMLRQGFLGAVCLEGSLEFGHLREKAPGTTKTASLLGVERGSRGLKGRARRAEAATSTPTQSEARRRVPTYSVKVGPRIKSAVHPSGEITS